MKVVFVGSGAFGVPTLRAAEASSHELVGVLTKPGKPAGRGQKIVRLRYLMPRPNTTLILPPPTPSMTIPGKSGWTKDHRMRWW